MDTPSSDFPWQVVVERDVVTKSWMDGRLSEVVDGDILVECMRRLSGLSAILPPPEPNGDWQIDEIHLTAEITAEGGLRFLGSATLGARGGVEVVLKRRPNR